MRVLVCVCVCSVAILAQGLERGASAPRQLFSHSLSSKLLLVVCFDSRGYNTFLSFAYGGAKLFPHFATEPGHFCNKFLFGPPGRCVRQGGLLLHSKLPLSKLPAKLFPSAWAKCLAYS